MLTDLLPLASYCFVMSSTPGPNNMMVTASGAHFGFRPTLPHIAGIHVGGALQTLLACLGLGLLFERWPALHHVLRVGGAAVLLWLAWKLATAAAPADAASARPMRWWQAALLQAVNPKSWIKALTLGSVFMPAQLGPATGALLVTAVGTVIGLPCVASWALFGQALRGWLRHPVRRRAFNAMMAAALSGLALRLLA